MLIKFLTIFFLLVSTASADTFGDTTQYADYLGFEDNKLISIKATLSSAPFTAKKLVAFLTFSSTAQAYHYGVKGLIYTDNAGYPDTLLCTSSVADLNGWTDKSWVELQFTDCTINSTGSYWLSLVNSDPDHTVAVYYDNGGTTNQYYEKSSSGSYTSPPDIFPADASGSSKRLSIYASTDDYNGPVPPASECDTRESAYTFYVRTDGGTSAQCDGRTNAAYSEVASPNCAYSHPAYALGSIDTTGSMCSGDILQFADNAEYKIGYGMPNADCSTSYTWDCVLDNIPEGIDAANPTRILGYNYETCSGTKTQLWGAERANYVLRLGGSNIDIQCLDITDHSPCLKNGPQEGDIDGQPKQCANSSYPRGEWAEVGLYSSAKKTTNISLTNVDIHGLATKGVYVFWAQDWYLDNVNITRNAYVGWDGDFQNFCYNSNGVATDECSAHNGEGGACSPYDNHCDTCTADTTNDCAWLMDKYWGTITLTDTKIDWNGCGERYPLQSTNLQDKSNSHTCWSGGDQAGYGDGIGLGDNNPGNWFFDGCSVSWNTSDGVDLLHGDGTGVAKFIRSKAEGNAGQGFKSSVGSTYIENSIIIGNCGFHRSAGLNATHDGSGDLAYFETCRANGNTIGYNVITPNTTFRISNSTVLGNGDTLIVSGGNDGACNENTKLYVYNSIFRGGKQFNDDSSFVDGGGDDISDFYYASGATGNGDGSCGSLAITEDYNIIYGTKHGDGDVDGANSRNIDPAFTGTIKMGSGLTNYYSDTNYAEQLYVSSSSPAVNSADETITLIGTGNDFNDFGRGDSWDIGALEYGTEIATGVWTVQNINFSNITFN